MSARIYMEHTDFAFKYPDKCCAETYAVGKRHQIHTSGELRSAARTTTARDIEKAIWYLNDWLENEVEGK